MNASTATEARTVESIDGAGGARCDTCDGFLTYSWLVRFTDGSHSYRCQTHLPAEPMPAGT